MLNYFPLVRLFILWHKTFYQRQNVPRVWSDVARSIETATHILGQVKCFGRLVVHSTVVLASDSQKDFIHPNLLFYYFVAPTPFKTKINRLDLKNWTTSGSTRLKIVASRLLLLIGYSARKYDLTKNYPVLLPSSPPSSVTVS